RQHILAVHEDARTRLTLHAAERPDRRPECLRLGERPCMERIRVRKSPAVPAGTPCHELVKQHLLLLRLGWAPQGTICRHLALLQPKGLPSSVAVQDRQRDYGNQGEFAPPPDFLYPHSGACRSGEAGTS